MLCVGLRKLNYGGSGQSPRRPCGRKGADLRVGVLSACEPCEECLAVAGDKLSRQLNDV